MSVPPLEDKMWVNIVLDKTQNTLMWPCLHICHTFTERSFIVCKFFLMFSLGDTLWRKGAEIRTWGSLAEASRTNR
jgi:hypothetical protein